MATTSQRNYPMPFTRVELVVLCVRDGELQVLLVQRQEAPHAGKWALPGGVVRIDLDANLEASAQRVGQERLGCRLPNLTQVVAVGGKARDPRAPWALSVVFASLVPPQLVLTAGKRVEALQWQPVSRQVLWTQMAFDHGALVRQAIGALREQVAAMRFPKGWLPPEFTIPELKALSEAILGQALDKVTFRRRLEAGQLLVPVEGKFRAGGAFRPAQVYRWGTSAGGTPS